MNNELTSNNVTAFVVSYSNLFAATYRGIYCSTNNGSNWFAANGGVVHEEVRALSVSDSIYLQALTGVPCIIPLIMEQIGKL